jgi:hypothetical protein
MSLQPRSVGPTSMAASAAAALAESQQQPLQEFLLKHRRARPASHSDVGSPSTAAPAAAADSDAGAPRRRRVDQRRVEEALHAPAPDVVELLDELAPLRPTSWWAAPLPRLQPGDPPADSPRRLCAEELGALVRSLAESEALRLRARGSSEELPQPQPLDEDVAALPGAVRADLMAGVAADDDGFVYARDPLARLEALLAPLPAIQVRERFAASASLSTASMSAAASTLLGRTVPHVTRVLASDRMAELGFPKCLAIGGDHLVVGTALGLILAFSLARDGFVALGTAEDTELGAVTAVDVVAGPAAPAGGAAAAAAADGGPHWLICGHEKGAVVLWDLDARKRLYAVVDLHKSVVAHVKFMPSGTSVLTADASGRTFVIKFTQRILLGMKHDVLMILNGKAGPVLSIEPLVLPRGAAAGAAAVAAHALHPLDLVAFCVPEWTIIAQLTPSVRILYKIPFPGDAQRLPYLAWRPPLEQLRGDVAELYRAANPVLAVAWGGLVQAFEVLPDSSATGGVSFVAINQHESGGTVAGMAWLDHLLVYLNNEDRLCVLDVIARAELDRLDVRSMALVFATRSKGAGLRSYHGSMARRGERLYFLGVNELYSVQVRSFTDRLASLRKKNMLLPAIQLAVNLLDRPDLAEMGLPLDPELRRRLLSDKVVELLFDHMQGAAEVLRVSEASASALMSITVDALCAVQRFDVLFAPVLRWYEGRGELGMFFDFLLPYIRGRMLPYVPPEVLRRMVEHFSQVHTLGSLELALVQLEPPALDLGLVRELSLQLGWVTAFLVVAARGERPLDAADMLLPLFLRSAVDPALMRPSPFATLSDTARRAAGFKTLAFLSALLRGSYFPHGAMPPPRAAAARRAAEDYVFELSVVGLLRPYPRLEALFAVSPDAFIAAVIVPLLAPDARPRLTLDDIVRVLTMTLLPPSLTETLEAWASANARAFVLLVFFARMLAQSAAAAQPPPAWLTATLRSSMLMHLAKNPSAESHGERQELFLLVVRSGVGPGDLAARDREIALSARPQPFYRAAEAIAVLQGSFDAAVSFRMRDPDRRNTVFEYIRSLLNGAELQPAAKQAVRYVTLSNLHVLLEIDAASLAHLILDQFTSSDVEGVSEKLAPYPEQQFMFLSGLLRRRDEDGDLVVALNFAPVLHLRFIELLCQFERPGVLQYLQRLEADVPLDAALEVVQRHQLMDATAFLLERMGDVADALRILLGALEAALARLRLELEKAAGETPAAADADRCLELSIALCERNTRLLMPEQAQSLWFQILDLLVTQVRVIKRGEDGTGRRPRVHSGLGAGNAAGSSPAERMLFAVSGRVSALLTRMAASLDTRAIVQYIVTQHGGQELWEFRSVLLSVLETSRFEMEMRQTVNKLVDGDLSLALHDMAAISARGIRPAAPYCEFCRRGISESDSGGGGRLLLFECGHVYHGGCLRRVATEPRCPVCRPTAALAARPQAQVVLEGPDDGNERSVDEEVRVDDDDSVLDYVARALQTSAAPRKSLMSVLHAVNGDRPKPRRKKKPADGEAPARGGARETLHLDIDAQ